MGSEARLNLLLTPAPAQERDRSQPWHQTLSHLLVPLGVRTFEATTGQEAVELIEKFPIHVAVVDTRLPSIGGMTVLELIQRLHASPSLSPPAEPGAAEGGIRFQFNLEERTEHTPQGSTTQRRIEVRFDARPAPKPGPAVILIAPPPPQQDPQLLQEALKFNAFSVLSEPVDVNLALDVMARALKRFHQNQWPV